MPDELGLGITQAQPAKSAIDTDQPQLLPTATFDRDGHAAADTRRGLPEVPGFQILEEIGRGGMGIVLRARDLELDRDVAVKVLRHAGSEESELSLRFVEEAHISGQLQHPGIAPVYRLGKLPDQSPFFAMKLIKGRTLAELLAERQDPSQDRPRLLKIFEQICQTLAYAHSRHVIHRDLKPANIMVGAFGEVQVMDWGLAKVLPKPGAIQTPQPAQVLEPTEVSTIRTPRSHNAGLVAETNTGSVMGTASYMPQEQALGEIDRLDERCDVFSLGATLCQILTGQPPYVAESSQALLGQAARADLAGAFARLDACGADAELISLTKRCLTAQPDDRPRNAGVLAAELTAYLESVEARLRQAELDRAKAEVQAREERRRRRLAVALGLALLLLVGLGSTGLLWFRSRQSETERIVTLAIGRAEQLRDQAYKMPVPEIVAKPGVDILDQAAAAVREGEAAVTAWNQAQAAAQEAESALASGIAPESLRRRVATLRGEIDQARKQIDKQHRQLVREDKLLRDLDEAADGEFRDLRRALLVLSTPPDNTRRRLPNTD